MSTSTIFRLLGGESSALAVGMTIRGTDMTPLYVRLASTKERQDGEGQRAVNVGNEVLGKTYVLEG